MMRAMDAAGYRRMRRAVWAAQDPGVRGFSPQQPCVLQARERWGREEAPNGLPPTTAQMEPPSRRAGVRTARLAAQLDRSGHARSPPCPVASRAQTRGRVTTHRAARGVEWKRSARGRVC